MEESVQAENEIWKIIDGYTYCEVSNYGRVRSKYLNSKNKKSAKRIRKLSETSKRPNKQGYLCVRMIRDIDGKSVCEYVHRLVAKTFIPNPNDFPYINHKDGNKHNNNVNNLEWCTESDNNYHAYKNDLKNDNCKVIKIDKNNIVTDIYYSISNASISNNYSQSYLRRLIATKLPDYYGNKFLTLKDKIKIMNISDE